MKKMKEVTFWVMIVSVIFLPLLWTGQEAPPATPAPVALFQPDTVRIEVGGQVFRYGTLTIFGADTLTIGAFLPEVEPQ